MKKSLPRGFTIVELAIIIVILGILAGLIVSTYAIAQNRAKVAKARNDIELIKRAMFAYKVDYGELPPQGDMWNYGTDPPSEEGWLETLEAMREGGYLSPGSVQALLKDPWGRTYGYDDNDCGSYAGPEDHTYIQSMGLDGVDNEGGDDIVVLLSEGCGP